MKNKPLDYSNLSLRLVKDFTWPAKYMFKFIVPFEAQLLNELKSLFSDEAVITHRESKNGKYISITAVQLMDDPDSVIDLYRSAEKIDKIIAL